LAGMMLGMAFLSIWTFVQPLLTYYLFFGNELFSALHYLFEKTLPYHGFTLIQLAWLLLGVVALKVFLGFALAWLAWRGLGKSDFQDKLLLLATQQGANPLGGKASTKRAALWLAFRDLFRPLFLCSLAVTVFFLFFSEHTESQRFWILMRPLAVGYAFFYFSRTLTLDRWLAKLHGTHFEGFARACQYALVELRQFSVRKFSSRA
jgi:hypothetical protein